MVKCFKKEPQKQLKQKGSMPLIMLLCFYTVISLAITLASYFVIANSYKAQNINISSIILAATTLIFIIASGFLLLTLKASFYYAIGIRTSYPSTWLQRNIIFIWTILLFMLIHLLSLLSR